MQAKLLRVLQDGTFERVGGTEVDPGRLPGPRRDQPRTWPRPSPRGRFREDLYYRLNVVSIELPPLRERLEDIPLLVDHFLEQLQERRLPAKTISRETLSRLARYDWPGNVRELEHVIEQMVVTTPGPVIEPENLPAADRLDPRGAVQPRLRPPPPAPGDHRRADRADRARLPPARPGDATAAGSTAAPSTAASRGGASARSSAATGSTRPTSSPSRRPPRRKRSPSAELRWVRSAARLADCAVMVRRPDRRFGGDRPEREISHRPSRSRRAARPSRPSSRAVASGLASRCWITRFRGGPRRPGRTLPRRAAAWPRR